MVYFIERIEKIGQIQRFLLFQNFYDLLLKSIQNDVHLGHFLTFLLICLSDFQKPPLDQKIIWSGIISYHFSE